MLSPTEQRRLTALVRFAGRTLAADFLLQQASGVQLDPRGAQAIIKVHIAHLRQKFLEVAGVAAPIATVRGMGYRFNPPERRRSRAARRG